MKDILAVIILSFFFQIYLGLHYTMRFALLKTESDLGNFHRYFCSPFDHVVFSSVYVTVSLSVCLSRFLSLSLSVSHSLSLSMSPPLSLDSCCVPEFPMQMEIYSSIWCFWHLIVGFAVPEALDFVLDFQIIFLTYITEKIKIKVQVWSCGR